MENGSGRSNVLKAPGFCTLLLSPVRLGLANQRVRISGAGVDFTPGWNRPARASSDSPTRPHRAPPPVPAPARDPRRRPRVGAAACNARPSRSSASSASICSRRSAISGRHLLPLERELELKLVRVGRRGGFGLALLERKLAFRLQLLEADARAHLLELRIGRRL